MSEVEQEQDFSVPLGGGALELEPRKALELRSFLHNPSYVVFREVLQAMNESNQAVLQLVEADERTLRVTQGKVLALAELATILEVDLETWYEEGKSNKAKAEEQDA